MLFDAHADRIERQRVQVKTHAYELSALVWTWFVGQAPTLDAYVWPHGRPGAGVARGGAKEIVAGFRAWMKSHGSE